MFFLVFFPLACITTWEGKNPKLTFIFLLHWMHTISLKWHAEKACFVFSLLVFPQCLIVHSVAFHAYRTAFSFSHQIKSTCCPFVNVGIRLSILVRMGKEKRKGFYSLVIWLFTFSCSLLGEGCCNAASSQRCSVPSFLSKAQTGTSCRHAEPVLSFFSLFCWCRSLVPTTFITITPISPLFVSYYVYHTYFYIGLFQPVWTLA